MNTENNGRDKTINNGESREGRNPDGTFQKGFGGRKPGSQNKMREKVSAFIDNNWDNMQEWLDELESSEKKIKYMIELLPYRLARLQAIAMTDSDGNDLKPKASIDYTRLTPAAFEEVLAATTMNENGDE